MCYRVVGMYLFRNRTLDYYYLFFSCIYSNNSVHYYFLIIYPNDLQQVNGFSVNHAIRPIRHWVAWFGSRVSIVDVGYLSLNQNKHENVRQILLLLIPRFTTREDWVHFSEPNPLVIH